HATSNKLWGNSIFHGRQNALSSKYNRIGTSLASLAVGFRAPIKGGGRIPKSVLRG
ncbi:hypothetical protein CDAR_86201, partial [Caerostris darwini]